MPGLRDCLRVRACFLLSAASVLNTRRQTLQELRAQQEADDANWQEADDADWQSHIGPERE